VTKKEIVATIAHELKETQLKTKDIVQRTFNAIVDTLIKEPSHRIELRNFGVFEVKARKPRKARNPRTGDKVDVPAKAVVTFKPGKYMEERVREIALSDLVKEEDEKDTASNGQELDGTTKTAKPRRKRKSTA
jgi:integration host factor subunit beta